MTMPCVMLDAAAGFMPGGAVGLLLWCFIAYVPVAMVLRLLEFVWVRRVSERTPAFWPFLGLHLGAAAVSALFGPVLCYLIGGQVAVALGISVGSVTVELWVTWWLISYALPLQLHYTANSILTRVGDEGKLKPGWMPWAWAGTTAVGVAVAWVPFWAGWVRL